ncbi:helix-turn-helix domain-containing transcriptional regulator [Methyloversatilis thermotolerans]|uniref:helix-turn-helix domain-containing transcriptional regulator n=1 Tax=Methyloversatilis thermotolerans TaxID=1346290 RepID=UPI00037F5EA5
MPTGVRPFFIGSAVGRLQGRRTRKSQRFDPQLLGSDLIYFPKDAGLGRESLYKALAPGAKPRFETVMKVARALGVKFTAQPA